MRAMVTRGVGFLGPRLCETLPHHGDSVACVDDLSTGKLHFAETLTAACRRQRYVS